MNSPPRACLRYSIRFLVFWFLRNGAMSSSMGTMIYVSIKKIADDPRMT
jgi:hypothetical protein